MNPLNRRKFLGLLPGGLVLTLPRWTAEQQHALKDKLHSKHPEEMQIVLTIGGSKGCSGGLVTSPAVIKEMTADQILDLLRWHLEDVELSTARELPWKRTRTAV